MKELLGLAPHSAPHQVSERYARLGCEVLDLGEVELILGGSTAMRRWMDDLEVVDAIVTVEPLISTAQPRVILHDRISGIRRERALHIAMYVLQFPEQFPWRQDRQCYVPFMPEAGHRVDETRAARADGGPQPDLGIGPG